MPVAVAVPIAIAVLVAIAVVTWALGSTGNRLCSTRDSRYGGSIGCYGGSTGCYRRRSIRRSSKDSWKEFEGVSDRVLSEQPISRIIDIRGIVKLLGRVSWSLIVILDSSTCLYSYLVIYSKSPTTPYRHPSVSLTLLYCDPSCCPLTVPTVTVVLVAVVLVGEELGPSFGVVVAVLFVGFLIWRQMSHMWLTWQIWLAWRFTWRFMWQMPRNPYVYIDLLSSGL